MSAVTKTLRMIFEDEGGSNRSVTITDPVESPDAQLVEDTMDHIVDNDIFLTSGGSLVAKVRAEVVERSVGTVYEA